MFIRFLLILLLFTSIGPAQAQTESSMNEIFTAYKGKSPLREKDRVALKDGFIELRTGFSGDEDAKDNPTQYAVETISAFVSGNNDGGAEYIATFAPNLAHYILNNKDRFDLWIVMDTEAKKLQTARIKANTAKIKANTAKIKANIARLKKLGDNLDAINNQLVD